MSKRGCIHIELSGPRQRLICVKALYSRPVTRKRSNLEERSIMAENVTKVPVKQEKIEKPSSTLQTWQPFEGLRDEIDSLFGSAPRPRQSRPVRGQDKEYAPYPRRPVPRSRLQLA